MATFLFIMIVLALLALVVTLVVFTLSQRKKARLQNPHDSYHGRYRADGVGTERLCRDAGSRFAAAGFRSGIPERGGAGGVVAAKSRSVVRYGGRSAF